jgi:hypothetical protein
VTRAKIPGAVLPSAMPMPISCDALRDHVRQHAVEPHGAQEQSPGAESGSTTLDNAVAWLERTSRGARGEFAYLAVEPMLGPCGRIPALLC